MKDTVDPANPDYNAKAARAKLMSKRHLDGLGQRRRRRASSRTATTTWSATPATRRGPRAAAAAICRSRPTGRPTRHHYEGGETRNFATYNPQVARDEMFLLGRHGPTKGNNIAPVRSSSALVLSSTNANRERIYIQQPPIAAARLQLAGLHAPLPAHRAQDRNQDLHRLPRVAAGDNNAIMAQLLLLGTNFVNFVGFNAWVGEERGIKAVQVTEWDEPQAVIGSYLQRYAYPDWYASHLANGRQAEADGRHGTPHRGADALPAAARRISATSPKAPTACASTTSPASPTRASPSASSPRRSRRSARARISRRNDATCVALPTNQPISPQRNAGRADARPTTRSSRSTRSTTTP